ncbi:uncharacterized protein METZ01_LOCUS225507 [marine metagenome]|uniref:NADH:quinone oxidoreductase/Mrp antiporter transmembrane domain-containing protein n=1 Tax=marine metagenome TaxID=408172 RepID=A0A382GDG8_9ZZZZ
MAVSVAAAELVLAAIIFSAFMQNDGPTAEGMRFVEMREWIYPLNINYHLGVDGLSAPMVLLTAILGLCAVFASFNIQIRTREYFTWLLVLQGAVMGVFVSLDFVLFFIFWELELLPMYFLIAIWGTGRKEYSAMKFLIFTLLGSAFMLVGMLVLFLSVGSFSIVDLPELVGGAKLALPATAIFALLVTAFAVKLPVWPVHSWLPDAHTDAPTAVSVMLAGVLLKMGGYGIIRIAIGIFPEVTRDYAWLLAVIAVISVLYGAVVTIRQTDLKRLIAFSSISHMGYVLLGVSSVAGVGGVISPVGLTGASMQLFSHGIITGLLFLLVGVAYEKVHTRHIPDLGGLISRMPITGIAFIIAGLASLGLPSTSGFISELLVFLGTFPVWSWLTAFGVFGIVITSGYILWTIQRVFFGPSKERFSQIGDASISDCIPIATLVVSIMIIGLYPSLLTDIFRDGLDPIIESLKLTVNP